METVGTILFVLVAMFVYFLPTIFAKHRGHKNDQAIFALNLFLGWTLIGWIAGLIWAHTNNVDESEEKPVKTGRFKL